MATAEKNTREALRTVSETENTIVLTLSEDEATALILAVGSIGGSPISPRKHTSAVYAALRDAGVPTGAGGGNPFAALLSGQLQFKDAPPAKPAVGDTVRVLEDDATIRPGEFVGKVGKVVRVSTVPGELLPYRVEFPDSEGTPYKSWNVARVEKVGADAPLAVGDVLRITRNWPVSNTGDSAGLREGALVTVVVEHPDDDGDIRVRDSADASWYLRADGPDKGWERVPRG